MRWRDIRRGAPVAATEPPDIERYADVFDAIDAAWTRSASIEASPSDVEPLAEALGIDDSGGLLAGHTLYRVPTIQVRVPSTVRLAIGLLQYGRWWSAATWHGFDVDDRHNRAILPDAARLLGRAIAPTANEVADLAWLLVPRADRDGGVECYAAPNAATLRALERHATPPISAPLRAALDESSRRVAHARAAYVADHATFSRRQPKATQFDKWLARLDAIAGR